MKFFFYINTKNKSKSKQLDFFTGSKIQVNSDE